MELLIDGNLVLVGLDGADASAVLADVRSRYPGQPVMLVETLADAVPPDTTPPTVAITSPADGATVNGTVPVTVDALDDSGVAPTVTFDLDGTPLSPPWYTTQVPDGSHVLTATATDAAGNTATSSVTVTVQNAPTADSTPPTASVAAPGDGSTVTGIVDLQANVADNVGVASVQFKVDGSVVGTTHAAPWEIQWDSATVPDGAHDYWVLAYDAAGNHTASAHVTLNVNNAAPPDTTPPTVAITSPAGGATVSGTVPVTVDAQDDSGATPSYTIAADGTQISADAPASWDSTQVPDGQHTLSATATDAAGNTATDQITVTVQNTAPSGGGTSPRSLLVSRQGMYDPACFVNQKLATPVDPNSSAVCAQLVQAATQSHGVAVNTQNYCVRVSVADASTPRKPVQITATGGAKDSFAGLCAQGVPIPPDLFISGGTDASFCVIDPINDQEWGLWRLDATDPNNLVASQGYRISYLSQNGGLPVDRYNGGRYGVLPTDPVAQATYEDHNWSVASARIALSATAITPEDLQDQTDDYSIRHIVGFAVYPTFLTNVPVPPATHSDGPGTGGLISEGMIFDIDPQAPMPAGLTSFERKMFRAAQTHGWVCTDKTGAGISFRGEPNCDQYIDRAGGAMGRFPWDMLRLLAHP